MAKKKKISIEQVGEDLRELFDIDKEGGASYSNENRFGIYKNEFGRLHVIDALGDYFKDKVIDGGYLKVDSITFVFTTFTIEEGHPSNKN